MDSAQKRDRDRKQRQKRLEKADRKRDRAEQKLQRRTEPGLGEAPADGSIAIDGAPPLPPELEVPPADAAAGRSPLPSSG